MEKQQVFHLLLGSRKYFFTSITFCWKFKGCIGTFNHSQNIWDKLYFSCEIEHYGKSSISIFQELLTCTDKTFILTGGLKALGNNLIRFWDIPDISWLMATVDATSVYTSLLVMITPPVTCGKRKIWSTI